MKVKNIFTKIGIAVAILAILVVITIFSKFDFSLYYGKNTRVEIYLGKNFEISNVRNEIARNT